MMLVIGDGQIENRRSINKQIKPKEAIIDPNDAQESIAGTHKRLMIRKK